MLKPKLRNILVFIFIKYLAFYIFLMFKNDNDALISIGDLKTFQDVFYYLIIFLTLPVLFSILLLFPISYTLKIRNTYGFVLSMGCILIFEYILYTYLASPSNYWNGIYNGALSVIFLVLFFFKSIRETFKKE